MELAVICFLEIDMRNHREEIELALAGGAPDLIPLTFYDGLFPPGFDPKPLQAKGLRCVAGEGYSTASPPT